MAPSPASMTGILRLGRTLISGSSHVSRSPASWNLTPAEGSLSSPRWSHFRSLGTVSGGEGGSMQERIETVRQEMTSEGKDNHSQKGPRGHWGNGTGSFEEAAAHGDISQSGYTTGSAAAPGLMGASLNGLPLEERLSSFKGGSQEGGRPTVVEALGMQVGLRVVGDETGGAYSVMEYCVPPGQGSYVHVHEREQEGWHLLEGRMTWQVEDRTVEAKPGDLMHMNKGTPHAFRNESNEPARMIVTCVPAGLEGYFQEIGTPVETAVSGIGSGRTSTGAGNEKPSVELADTFSKAVESAKRFGLTYPHGFQ